MQDIQKIYHYLPQEVLTYIAGELGLSEAKVYGVATFYENFSLEPKGKYVIKICDGTACHVRNSTAILNEIRSVLGVSQEDVYKRQDFKRGRRTTEERLCRNNLIPTLKDAVPGDLSLVFPHRIMVDIEEMIEALDKVTPGIASDETLLYGVEVKFYSNKVVVNKDCLLYTSRCV